MPKKKRFIDKNHAVTFKLVHRSQRDPLVTDENAPQHVLQVVKNERNDDLEKYGIYYDDDYDYMQHLKERCSHDGELVEVPTARKERTAKTSEKKLQLPSSVFQSEVEETVGLLNKAAPKSGLQLDLDPDIVAAMDDDFDFSDPENQLEDDFVLLANRSDGECSDAESGSDLEIGSDEEMGSDFENNDEKSDIFEREETKSRFTEYSMSSSVLPRNEQLTMLDDRFQEMYSQYDDNEIGALDCEEIEGEITTQSEMIKKIADEFKNDREEGKLELSKYFTYNESSDSDDSACSVVEVTSKPQWDCESVLSTNSNLYNHPKVISAPPPSRIKINSKTGIPILNDKLTASNLAKLDGAEKKMATGPGSLVSIVSTLSVRPKDESPADRNERKKAFREYKKARRIERKANSEAFKEEKKRMEKVIINNFKNRSQIPI